MFYKILLSLSLSVLVNGCYADSLAGHPMARFTEPEDGKIMEYFDFADLDCDPKSYYYNKSDCDLIIQENLWLAHKINLKITEKQLRNPAFWKLQNEVSKAGRAKVKALLDAGLGKKQAERVKYDELWAAFTTEQNRRLKAFREGTYR